jgi:hypothetical protein
MRVQDYIADQAKLAAEELFRYAKAVPADKLEWNPAEGGRSVLSLCQEIAMTPTWTMIAFSDKDMTWSEEESLAQRKQMEQFSTVDHCEKEFAGRFKAVETMFRGFSDEDLKRTKWLPYNGGRDHTFLEMMDYPRWNCCYHAGQIAYIQTLYGDREMH